MPYNLPLLSFFYGWQLKINEYYNLMMKISLKVDYACRVLAQLARYYGNHKLVHLEHLASAEEIPANYLVQILNDLRNGGLISSRRGKRGGYSLAQAPEDISLYDIIQVMDGELLNVNMSGKGESGPQMAKVWAELSRMLESKTREFTLELLLRSDSKGMYYI